MKTYYRFCQTYIFLLLLSLTLPLLATEQPEYSTAGFFENGSINNSSCISKP